MFGNCDKCKSLEEALKYERDRVKELTESLIALADARAFQAIKFDYQAQDPDQYYGGADDVLETRNEFGEKVLIKVKNERTV